jgi:RHS repeat-associated protein
MNALTIAPSGANNRLTRWGGKTYSYDPNGNLLADGTHSYQWNERNQLTGLSAGATSLASFSYDSLGRRSAKTVAGATTGFVYDGDTFVQELLGASSNSAVKAQLLTGGIDETFLRIEGASRHSFLADGNNNTVRLLDANQAKVVDYTYEPYGRTTADATNGNTQQYTGRENDNPGNAGGLYYYRARYYMPGCARFISEDPIGWASGQTNNYGYVGGDPVGYVDPYGLCPDLVMSFGAGMTVFNGNLTGPSQGAAIGFNVSLNLTSLQISISGFEHQLSGLGLYFGAEGQGSLGIANGPSPKGRSKGSMPFRVELDFTPDAG